VSTARDLVNSFSHGLEGHVCGSPQLVTRQQDTVSGLLEMLSEKQLKTLLDSSEDSLTFLDLPRGKSCKNIYYKYNYINPKKLYKSEKRMKSQKSLKRYTYIAIQKLFQNYFRKSYGAFRITFHYLKLVESISD
jgi:hypothetical protein